MDSFMQPAFWAALGNIILVNIVLSGDNAVVIALAARSLPANQQRKAIVFGSGAAIVMRVLLTGFAVELLTYPWLKIVGALLLLYIGIQLLADDDSESEIRQHSSVTGAVRTILVADLVMSLDNVIGVAAAAKGNMTLLVLGLAISIPLIVFGSTIVLKAMERLPIIVTLGGALLGYLAGEMVVTDPAIAGWISGLWPHHDLVLVEGSVDLSITGLAGAVLVIAIGKWLARRSADSRRESVAEGRAGTAS